MVKVKVLQVTGEVISRNGRRASNLFERIEKDLGAFLSGLNPKDILSITQSVNNVGVASGGDAVYTVTYSDSPSHEKGKEK